MLFDRCVGFLAWSYWGGVRTVRQDTAVFPHDVLLLSYVAALPTTRIQNSWSSKSLVKEGVTYYLCCMSYYCRSTTSSTPYYFLKPWTMVNKNRYWAVSHLEAALPFFVVRGFIYMRRRLFPEYHIWPILTMEQLPHVFVPSRTPLVLEFPCGLELEPVISKTGYSLPVDRFRLSLPGRFNLDCVVAVASVRSCLDLEELFQLALHRTRHCNIFCR